MIAHLIAHMVCRLGFTLDEIGDLTVNDLVTLLELNAELDAVE